MRSLATRKRDPKADPWVKTNRARKWSVKQRQAKEDLEGPKANEKRVWVSWPPRERLLKQR